MARTPGLKVYTPTKEYVASCKYAEDAAAVCGAYGPGATIRLGHRVKDTVYTDGVDGEAAQSWDEAAIIVRERIAERQGR